MDKVTTENTQNIFHVFHSNSLEDLAQLTAKLMETNLPESIFTSFDIIIPNPGMKNWLDIKLAQRLKISMMNKYHQTWSYVWSLFGNLGLVEQTNPQQRYRRDNMIWTIYSVLKNEILTADDPNVKEAFGSIFNYVYEKSEPEELSNLAFLNEHNQSYPGFIWNSKPSATSSGAAPLSTANSGADDSAESQAFRLNDTKLYQFSEAIADIFDRYIVYRSDWLKDCSQNPKIMDHYLKRFNEYQVADVALRGASLDPNFDATGAGHRALKQLWKGISVDEFKSLGTDEQLLIKNNIWQVILWKKVVQTNKVNLDYKNTSLEGMRHYEGHIADMINLFNQRIEKDVEMQRKLPRTLFIFGISSLEPLFFNLLKSMSRYTHIFYMYFNPCRTYWCDLDKKAASYESVFNRISRGLTRQIISSSEVSLEDNSTQMVSFTAGENNTRRNRLLASWGRIGSDNFFQLVENQTQEMEVYEDPLDGHHHLGVLQLLQHAILNDLEYSPLDLDFLQDSKKSSTPDLSRLTWENLEHNIQIHACYSKLREIQSVYDRVLHLFNTDSTLKPNDIVVMSPNISSYVPLINGVFGNVQSQVERNIPYVISDQSYAELSSFLNSIFLLLDLVHYHIDGDLVMELFDVTQIRNKFKLQDSDLKVIDEWIEKAPIRGDYDESDLNGTCTLKMEKEGEHVPVYSTWRRSLERLMVGSVLPKADFRWLDDIQPYTQVSGQNMDALASVSLFVRSLATLRQQLTSLGGASNGLSAKDWQEFMQTQVLEKFYASDEESENDIQGLKEMIAELISKFENIDPSGNEKISLDVFVAYLKNMAKNKTSFTPFMSGRVNFCTFVPMRSIPFRHIFIIGMNSTDFPRQDDAYDFDLMRRNNGQLSRRGDRSRRQDDRYMFLETIMSASESIYISYIGRSNVNNSVRNPSVVVTELLNFLSENLLLKDYANRVQVIYNVLKNGDLGTEDLLKYGQRLYQIGQENIKKLQDPNNEYLVAEDTLNIWDPINFASHGQAELAKQAGQLTQGDGKILAQSPRPEERGHFLQDDFKLSFQDEWSPVSDGQQKLRMEQFFTKYVLGALGNSNPNVDRLITGDENSWKQLIANLLRQILHSPFELHDRTNEHIALLSLEVSEVLQHSEFKKLQQFLINSQSNYADVKVRFNSVNERFLSQLELHLPRVIYQIVADKFELDCGDETAGYDLKFKGYSFTNHLNRLLTDAGQVDPTIAVYCSEDVKKLSDIPVSYRTLTLSLRNLSDFFKDPLDALFSQRFSVRAEKDERYAQVRKNTENLDYQDASSYGFEIRQGMVDRLQSLYDDISSYPELEAALLDDEHYSIADLMNLIFNKLQTAQGNSRESPLNAYLTTLKYGGQLPNGSSAYDICDVDELKEIASSQQSSSETPKVVYNADEFLRPNFYAELKNRLTLMRALSQEKFVHSCGIPVHVEVSLSASQLPQPYRQVFLPFADGSFRVVVEDAIDEIYTKPESAGTTDYLISIQSFAQGKLKNAERCRFLFKWILVSQLEQYRSGSRNLIGRYYQNTGELCYELDLAKIKMNPSVKSLLDGYFKQIIITYLRAMCQPLPNESLFKVLDPGKQSGLSQDATLQGFNPEDEPIMADEIPKIAPELFSFINADGKNAVIDDLQKLFAKPDDCRMDQNFCNDFKNFATVLKIDIYENDYRGNSSWNQNSMTVRQRLFFYDTENILVKLFAGYYFVVIFLTNYLLDGCNGVQEEVKSSTKKTSSGSRSTKKK